MNKKLEGAVPHAFCVSANKSELQRKKKKTIKTLLETKSRKIEYRNGKNCIFRLDAAQRIYKQEYNRRLRVSISFESNVLKT